MIDPAFDQASLNHGVKPRLRAAPELPHPWIVGGSPLRPYVLFLDFDGVLHPLGPLAARFSQAACLAEALDFLDPSRSLIGICLSTSWRFQPWDLICSELAAASSQLASRLEGRSGCIGPASRAEEALAYIAARPGEPPEGFAALDDQHSIFGPFPPAWLALCNSSTGFQSSDLDALACALGVPYARRGPTPSP